MPSIDLSYVNIALDSLGLTVVLIIFAACLGEQIKKRSRSTYFIRLLVFVIVALIADIMSWIGEGHPQLRVMTLVSNTVASSAVQIAIICFMEYLHQSLYKNSKAAARTLSVFRIFCVVSVLLSIGNAFFGYAFSVDASGHYVRSENVAMVICHLLFSIASFVALVFMALFANSSTKENRIAFIIYTLFPIAGIVIDYTVPGLSLTYVGIAISVLVIYTNIYLQSQKMIDAQKNALMLSQINPHFIYNTLSTIASMCDISPKEAKTLTIDFAQYLRRNIGTLASEELIPFEQEMEHVACYLKIEQARFGDRLEVNYSIQCKDFKVPPLTVQPLVENAIKHGVTKKAEGGLVKISTYEKDDCYVIEILDYGVGFDPDHRPDDGRTHVGLENVRSRLKDMCNGHVTVKSKIGVGTRVTLEIPVQPKKRRGKA